MRENDALELLLPDDEEASSSELLIAIIDWAQAFLAGFKGSAGSG